MDEEKRRNLMDLFRNAKVLDHGTGWISMNRAWFEPEGRNLLTDALYDYLGEHTPISPETVILSPEGIVSTYGALPIASALASRFQCRLALWRELGDIVTTAPSIFPNGHFLPSGLECILFQDVVGRGSTLRKMLPQLQEMKWSIRRYVAIVERTYARDEREANIDHCADILTSDFQFLSFLADKDIER